MPMNKAFTEGTKMLMASKPFLERDGLSLWLIEMLYYMQHQKRAAGSGKDREVKCKKLSF